MSSPSVLLPTMHRFTAECHTNAQAERHTIIHGLEETSDSTVHIIARENGRFYSTQQISHPNQTQSMSNTTSLPLQRQTCEHHTPTLEQKFPTAQHSNTMNHFYQAFFRPSPVPRSCSRSLPFSSRLTTSPMTTMPNHLARSSGDQLHPTFRISAA